MERGISFNSILVWLKEGEKDSLLTKLSPFQFHSGLIKSEPAGGVDPTLALFQFHSGLIKSLTRQVCDAVLG